MVNRELVTVIGKDGRNQHGNVAELYLSPAKNTHVEDGSQGKKDRIADLVIERNPGSRILKALRPRFYGKLAQISKVGAKQVVGTHIDGDQVSLLQLLDERIVELGVHGIDHPGVNILEIVLVPRVEPGVKGLLGEQDILRPCPELLGRLPSQAVVHLKNDRHIRGVIVRILAKVVSIHQIFDGLLVGRGHHGFQFRVVDRLIALPLIRVIGPIGPDIGRKDVVRVVNELDVVLDAVCGHAEVGIGEVILALDPALFRQDGRERVRDKRRVAGRGTIVIVEVRDRSVIVLESRVGLNGIAGPDAISDGDVMKCTLRSVVNGSVCINWCDGLSDHGCGQDHGK